MARRPVFVPNSAPPYYSEQSVAFQWFPGFAAVQQRRSIESLHEAASEIGLGPLLEISSRSASEIGVRLSAFNLSARFGDQTATVEAWFQSSKFFEGGGPFLDFLKMPGRDIKRDERLRGSGRLCEFRFGDEVWPLIPRTAFYDWLYLNALCQHPELDSQLLAFKGFTDIAFNPEKSLNCQARSAAMFVGLSQAGCLAVAKQGRGHFIAEVYNAAMNGVSQSAGQRRLPLQMDRGE